MVGWLELSVYCRYGMRVFRPLKNHFEEAQNDPFESEPKNLVDVR